MACFRAMTFGRAGCSRSATGWLRIGSDFHEEEVVTPRVPRQGGDDGLGILSRVVVASPANEHPLWVLRGWRAVGVGLSLSGCPSLAGGVGEIGGRQF